MNHEMLLIALAMLETRPPASKWSAYPSVHRSLLGYRAFNLNGWGSAGYESPMAVYFSVILSFIDNDC